MEAPRAATADAVATDAGRRELARLFEREFDSVYRFCLTRTGSHTAAEDVASDVFAEAARRFASTPTPSIDIAWLIAVARRRVIDRWRSEERHRARAERMQQLAAPQATAEEPGAAAAAGEVIDALGRLPTRQRIALTLRYLDGFSVEEVAKQLETTYRSAESLLSRGRAGLCKTLEATT